MSTGSDWTLCLWKDLVAACSRYSKKRVINGGSTMWSELIYIHWLISLEQRRPGYPCITGKKSQAYSNSEIYSGLHSSWATELSSEFRSLGSLPTFHLSIVPFIIVQACDLGNAFPYCFLLGMKRSFQLVLVFWTLSPSLASFFDPDCSAMWRLLSHCIWLCSPIIDTERQHLALYSAESKYVWIQIMIIMNQSFHSSVMALHFFE